MAYHKYPRNLTCNGVYCDWDKMTASYLNPTDVSTNSMLASFIRLAGSTCNLKYHKKDASGTASGAKKCLKWFGYNDVHKELGYDAATIISMIDDDNPVFISALSRTFGGGHAWVIDGYKYKRKVEAPATRSVYYGKRTSNPSYKTLPILNKTLMVHCNFGWKGLSNGYYASGIFNISDGPLEYAEGDLHGPSGVTSNYHWWFRVLTYSNPNK